VPFSEVELPALDGDVAQVHEEFRHAIGPNAPDGVQQVLQRGLVGEASGGGQGHDEPDGCRGCLVEVTQFGEQVHRLLVGRGGVCDTSGPPCQRPASPPQVGKVVRGRTGLLEGGLGRCVRRVGVGQASTPGEEEASVEADVSKGLRVVPT
jgi:hypothetical protein